MRHDMVVNRLLQTHIEARNSKCVKYQVGCIITDQNGRIISSGYNGTPPHMINCCDRYHPDEMQQEHMRKDHTEWSGLYEIHAEVNAIVRANESLVNAVLFCTHTPCCECIKTIAATGIKRIICSGIYGKTNNKQIEAICSNAYINFEVLECPKLNMILNCLSTD